jgi:GTPase SAR1 family protein
MLMIVIGPGGTGKSTLLNAITTTFEKNNAQHLLKKTTMSGVTASLVGGMTLHWLTGLPARSVPQSDIWPDNSGKDIKEHRILNLLLPLWIAIDEAGMCTVDMIILLSQVAGKV